MKNTVFIKKSHLEANWDGWGVGEDTDVEYVKDASFKPIESCPKNGDPFWVKQLIRYLPYKKGSGMEGKGRFQEHNGYGWQNIDWEPSEWCEYGDALTPEEVEADNVYGED